MPYFLSPSRRFGTKCAGCLQGISPSDLVRKARSKVFHLNCFTCMVCNKQLSTGEELYVIDENKFVCKEDYLTSGAIKEVNLNSGNGRIKRKKDAFMLFSSSLCAHLFLKYVNFKIEKKELRLQL